MKNLRIMILFMTLLPSVILASLSSTPGHASTRIKVGKIKKEIFAQLDFTNRLIKPANINEVFSTSKILQATVRIPDPLAVTLMPKTNDLKNIIQVHFAITGIIIGPSVLLNRDANNKDPKRNILNESAFFLEASTSPEELLISLQDLPATSENIFLYRLNEDDETGSTFYRQLHNSLPLSAHYPKDLLIQTPT
ncbi:MAG: hypothetical protein AABZ55_03300 [Bdellovibrionota bacterium]